MIIRPPRAEYEIADLGPTSFTVSGRPYHRRDVTLINDRGMELQCSHYLPTAGGWRSRQPHPQPCVIFLHGNCSSRVEALDVVPVLLPRGLSVFCLDLSGSGMSGGEYISLGYFESQDVHTVTEYLRKTGIVTSVGLWGRSMGAATSVLCAAEDQLLGGCVIDSAFGDLKQVAEELVNNGGVPIPTFLLNMALSMVSREISSRAQFNIDDLKPLAKAPQATCPAFFATAEDDMLVLPHHTRDLHAAWGGKVELATFWGGHNGVRPDAFMEAAADFLKKNLLAQQSHLAQLKVHQRVPATRERLHVAPSDAPAPPPVKKPEVSAPREGQQPALFTDLCNMGFPEDFAKEASQRFTSVEASIDWCLTQASAALGAARKELRPPESTLHLGSMVALRLPDEIQAPADPAPPPHQTSHTPKQAGGLAVGSHAATPPVALSPLAKQLLDLGFSEPDAAEAAKRFSSVEAAVDWLVSKT